MRAQCCICQEQFENDAELVISALECGHTFHGACLTEWLKNGNTCPSCRKAVKRKGIIPRLFFDHGDEIESGVDPSKLQNDLDGMKLELRQKEKQKSELISANDALLIKIDGLKSDKVKIEKQFKAEQSTRSSFKKQLEYFESQQTALKNEREECRKIKKKLVELQSLDTLLNGCESEASQILTMTGESETAVVSLSRQCALIKREYEKLKSEKRVLKEEVERYRKESVYKTRTVQESKKEVLTMTDQLKRSEEDLKKSEMETSMLKKKLSQLKHAINSPSAAASSSFMETLMEGSPMSSTPVRLKSAGGQENLEDLNITPDLFDSPQSNYTTQKKRPLDTDEVKFMKISSAAENISQPSKKMRKEVQGSNDIRTIASMNIFKKKALGESSSTSITRKGYDGLGGHTTFVNSTKVSTTFKKPAPRKPLSKLAKTPSLPNLPNLDNFILE